MYAESGISPIEVGLGGLALPLSRSPPLLPYSKGSLGGGLSFSPSPGWEPPTSHLPLTRRVWLPCLGRVGVVVGSGSS